MSTYCQAACSLMNVFVMVGGLLQLHFPFSHGKLLKSQKI